MRLISDRVKDLDVVSCQFAMHYMFEKEVSELYGLKYRVCYVVSSRMCLISSKWEDTSSQLSLIVFSVSSPSKLVISSQWRICVESRE